ncbi:hypothetical protein [Alteromonas facilis]|uniref:hypothetical protein n=1 Tax=Alteromonas facilis TaxID=2048004 RepID=UPI000C292562|nr:hypothetical protein [Alteromonas facilis]
MITVIDVASNLLIGMAKLTKDIGEQNEAIMPQMAENMLIYARLARTLSKDPESDFEGVPAISAAISLLNVAADFLDNFATQQTHLLSTLNENADVYRSAAKALEEDPYKILSESDEEPFKSV